MINYQKFKKFYKKKTELTIKQWILWKLEQYEIQLYKYDTRLHFNFVTF